MSTLHKKNKEESERHIELDFKNRKLNKERDETVREIEPLGTKTQIKLREYENKEENG